MNLERISEFLPKTQGGGEFGRKVAVSRIGQVESRESTDRVTFWQRLFFSFYN